MRAVFVSYYHPHDRMAAAVRLQRTLVFLERAGWTVQVVSPPPANAKRPVGGNPLMRVLSKMITASALTWQAMQSQADVYLVSAPPFSMMIPATFLKVFKSKAAVVFEERDLLSISPLLTFRMVRGSRWMKALEHWLLTRADAVSVASLGTKEELERHWTDLTQRARPIEVVSNGFFRQDYSFLEMLPEPKHEGPLRIVHTGNFYGSRHPQPILAALSEIRIVRPDLALSRSLHFLFLGLFQSSEDQESFMRAARKDGLENLFTLRDLVPRREALQAIHDADVALLITHRSGSESAVPAKLYEYIALGRPILALTSDSSVTGPIARHQLGWSIQHENITELRDRLLWMIEHTEEIRSRRLPGTSLVEFDAEAQLEKLQDLLLDVCRR